MANTSRPTRYSSLSLKDLIALCAGPCNDEAWEEFDARVRTPIRLSIVRTVSIWGKASTSIVDDLIQATYLKLWQGGCCLLQDFAVARPEAIVGYLKRTAANATHDYFKHEHSQSQGGDQPHVSLDDAEPPSANRGSEEHIAYEIALAEIDEQLKRCLRGPDRDRDRTIFWLYFRQGMSTREIANLPTIGLSAKGVGSVIERLKHSLREQILDNDRNFNVREQEQ